MNLTDIKKSKKHHVIRLRVGRGIGSGRGKTSGRGHKGAGSRSGWKSRARYEGGQLPLYRKMPERGFTRGRFLRRLDSINLAEIELLFHDGDVVDLMALRDKGFLKGTTYGLKILGHGELTKKVTIEAHAISASAKEKLDRAGVSYSII